MTSRQNIMVLLFVGGGALLLFLLGALGPSPVSAQACGPGNHWIDTCAAGTDSVPDSGAVVGIDINGDCNKDLNFVLSGPVDQITRSAPLDDSVQFPGLRPVDAHLDVIDTEILEMSLTGMGLTLRVGTATAGIDPGVQQTLGAIAEDAGDNTLGESFFDVFFEVDDGGSLGGPFYNQAPLTIQADPEIDRVPPETIYLHPSPLCLDLYDAPSGGSDTGINLVEAQHEIPAPVGGILEDPDVEALPSESADSSGGLPAGVIAAIAGVAAAAIATTTGGFALWRRRIR